MRFEMASSLLSLLPSIPSTANPSWLNVRMICVSFTFEQSITDVQLRKGSLSCTLDLFLPAADRVKTT